jgi:hypothetical protein
MTRSEGQQTSEFVTVNKRPPAAHGHMPLSENSNHDLPVLGLPTDANVLGPGQLTALFAEWRADYAAGTEPLPPPGSAPLAEVDRDIDGPDR